ncbi:CPBP family intramembrane metalloprotease [Flavobacteriaceae bacterium]|nr:CPBP family intramembrane metalloprotease [Flavobacteriaceae bacterium]
MVVLYIEPINNFILQNYFYWIPESFNIENSQINNNLTITIVGFTLLIFIDGVLNPIVEELYFRGFLMPRLSRYLYFSAFISAFLFSISHFWFPWNILQTFLIVLPIYIIVYRTKSIYISIVTHCTGNLIGIAISLFNFFN